MIRKLMASSALVALMSAGAVTFAQAQSEPAQPVIVQDNSAAAQDATAPAATVADSTQPIAPEQPTLASGIIGRSVYSSTDPQSENIGEVNDLIVAEDGSVTHAVIGVGGFLGIGEKDVAVPFDQLKVVEDNGDLRLVYSATKDQLNAAPAFDRTAYDPAARGQPTTSTAENAPDASTTGLQPPAAPADTGNLAAAPAPTNDQMAAGTSTDNTAAQPPAAAAETGDLAAAPAPTGDQMAAGTSTDNTAAPAETGDLAAAPAPTNDQMAAGSSTDNTASSVTPPAESTNAAVPPAGDLGFVSASADQIRASTLIGKNVYGPDNLSIGEVSDLVLQKESGARVALVDVGGFLGIGEKTVAIPFTDLKFMTTADNPEPQVTVAMTKEQLEQQPAYDTSALDNAASAGSTTATQQPTDTTGADTTASTRQPADSTGLTPAPADQMAADNQAATGTDQMTTGSITPTQDIAATKLMGASVNGTDDSTIGEVGDIVFDPKGDINAVVVDVGGFLGIGEKPVALNFDNLDLRSDQNGTLSVSVAATKDQLDKAPTYQTVTAQ